jgi:hypothetical protein
MWGGASGEEGVTREGTIEGNVRHLSREMVVVGGRGVAVCMHFVA